MVSPFHLLRPRYWTVQNVLKDRRTAVAASLFLLGGLAVLVGIHVLSHRMLCRFDEVPLVGALLKHHLLSMLMFSLLLMMIFSNLISTLQAFFLSRDLAKVFASPFPYGKVFVAKFIEACTASSWMVMVLLMPIAFAFARTYDAPLAFYLFFWLPLLPFFVLGTSVGLCISVLLAAVSPVRRLAQALKLSYVVAVGLVILLFRLLRPEDLIRPDKFESFARYVFSLHTPLFSMAPSFPTSRLLISMMTLNAFQVGTHVWNLLAWSGGAFALSAGISWRWHRIGWQRFEESQVPEGDAEEGRLMRWTLFLVRCLPRRSRFLLVKEIKVFVRSPILWIQLLLMAIIVIIYAYNVYLLPVDAMANLNRDLPSLAILLNVFFVSLIVLAAALRFGFPAISMEGACLYMIRSSPLSLRRFLLLKLWVNVVPLWVVAISLTTMANAMVGASLPLWIWSLLSVTGATVSVTALALAFGTVFRRLDGSSLSHMPSGPGGMAFLMTGFVLLSVFLAFQIYPAWLYILSQRSLFRPQPGQWARVVLSFLCGFSVLAAVGSRSLRHAEAVLGDMEPS